MKKYTVEEFSGNIRELFPAIKSWGLEYNGENFGLYLVVGDMANDILALVLAKNKALFVLKHEDKIVGFMGVSIFKSPIGVERIANEHYWYVLPEHRRCSPKLTNAFLAWAKKNCCTHIMKNASNLASDHHDKVCRIYEKRGMKKFETTYIMEI